MKTDQKGITEFTVKETNFHHVLSDIENIYWFFLISIRTLSDYDIQNILKTKDSNQPGYLPFLEMLEKFNKTTNLKIEKIGNQATAKLNILKQMVFTGKAMAILTYDYLSSSSYNAKINQDTEFQFLRHIRNGAAHNNKFNLRDKTGEWKISEDEIIEWNGMKIDRSLQGTIVFNNFISLAQIFILANHFSERLKKIDNNKLIIRK